MLRNYFYCPVCRGITVHFALESVSSLVWNTQVAADLKRVYTAATQDEAEQYLTEFESAWNDAYPPIAQS